MTGQRPGGRTLDTRGGVMDAMAGGAASIAERSGLMGTEVDRLKSSTIRMVDDEPTTLDVLEMFLQGEGYEHLLATTESTRALDLVRRERPDVLLLDLMMPEVGGLELLAAMRSDRELCRTPVIVLTSSTDAETKLKALELGAADFLGKPVDPSELALRLRNTLAAKAYQDRLAYYDGLTGLPNRLLFKERLTRALRRAEHETTDCAVLHLDLDRFKQINDNLGHVTGDGLLKAVAERLEQCVRPGDLVGSSRVDQEDNLSRVGGDEFTLFLFGVDSVERAARIAQRINVVLEEPFHLEGRTLFVTASIGVGLFPADGNDIDTLMRHADIAMSHAKQSGGNTFRFYASSLNAESLERLSLENDLRRALDRGELSLYYQPKLSVASGRIVGAEALMRWKHPKLGLVPPDRFIRIAEEAGMIAALGEWALETACRECQAWKDAGFAGLRIAVNVSSQQFFHSDMVGLVRGQLEDSGLDPSQLVIELTETLIMQNPDEASKLLRRIKDLGPRISIDDFGTGYSSLAYLKHFCADELKIDRYFVKDIHEDSQDAAIVTAVVALAHSLRLTVVAEGVETKEQLQIIAERSCDEYQGYLFSPAVPSEAFRALLHEHAQRGAQSQT